FQEKQAHPPKLVLYTELIDRDNDGVFYEDEMLDLYLIVLNLGEGSADHLRLTLKDQSGFEVLSITKKFERLLPGEKNVVPVSFKLPRSFDEDELALMVSLEETDGFSPAPLDVRYEISEWEKPKLEVVQLSIPPVLSAGRTQQYGYVLRNIGANPAKQFALTAELNQAGMTLINQSWPTTISKLMPGEELPFYVVLKAGFDNTASKVNIDFVIEDQGNSESSKRFDKLASFNVPLLKQLNDFQIENYSAIASMLPSDRLGAASGLAGLSASELKAPTLMNNKQAQANSFAVLIGNRDYKEAQKLPVLFAHKDAETMQSVLTHNLGVPKENIMLYKNATLGQFKTLFGEQGEVGQLQQIVNGHAQTNELDTVYVYYSGHGVPAMNKAWSAYLMPSDANPYYIDKSGYALETLFEQLALIDAKHIVVFLDACFSGNSESGSLFPNTSAGTLMMPNIPYPKADQKITVFSATDSQSVATWLPPAGQGLFTHFLAKGLSGEADDGDHALSLKELYDYVYSKVTRVAALQAKTQSPSLSKRTDFNLVRYEF
ncbi:MAG: hypothetical protein ACJAS1_004414, partial [Oleiphilaceae bacterium]